MNNLTPILAAAGGVSTLTGIDWLAIAFYFGILLCVAWWVVSKRKDTAADYFLAGRNLGWWVIGASIFASNIGSEHIVGLAGSGAKDGVAMAHYELHAWCLLVLAWVFVPFYARSLVFTMPEFLERRFSTSSRYVLSIVSLITFVVSKIAVGIFAGGVVFATLLPEMQLNIGGHVIDSFWIGSVLVIALTGLYTALGGMRAVAYNDAVQVVVLITGSALLTVYGLVKLGGWHELRALCGSNMFNLWKPITPPGVESTWAPVLQKGANGEIVKQAWYFNSYYPWPGMLICAPVIGLWYWCTDQYIVQRALGAPNEQIARRGSIFAGFLKLFPPYLFIIPGMICFALVKSSKVPALTAAFTASPDAAQGAFPLMVEHLLPAGLRGIVVAGLLSALMGSLAGVFNACSTLFTVDIYEKLRPKASQHEIVRMGRIATGDHGAHRHGLDSRRQGRHRPVQLSAIRAGLPGTADLRGVLLWRVLEASQCPGLPLGDDCRLCPWRLSHVGRHAGHDRQGQLQLCGRLLPVDHQQHQLPVLQRVDHDRVGRSDGRGQLHDRGSRSTQGSRA